MSVLVLGAGLSGVAAVRAAHRRGLDVRCYDERLDADLPSDLSDVELHTGPWTDRLLAGIERVVTSPGFPPHGAPLTAATHSGVPILTEAAFGLEHLDSTLVAVTGTNGKSTVVSETTQMLTNSGIDAVAAGNIGSPISDIVESPAVVVAELSSFQLEYMSVSPDAATILNIAPDHLDWHGSMDAYVAAKASIANDIAPDGILAYNADDPLVTDIADRVDGRTIACSGRHLPDGGNGIEGDTITIGAETFPAPTDDPSYLFDLVVAATLARHVGASVDGVSGTLGQFAPGSHRRNVVAEIEGVPWINDSKATNPAAAVAAASAYESVRLLAGGRNKDLDLRLIGGVPSVIHVYAFGESGPQIVEGATRPASVHATMRDAMDAARRDARPGEVVLLSPGCTSFDEFASYAERGQRFEEIVHIMRTGVRS